MTRMGPLQLEVFYDSMILWPMLCTEEQFIKKQGQIPKLEQEDLLTSSRPPCCAAWTMEVKKKARVVFRLSKKHSQVII